MTLVDRFPALRDTDAINLILSVQEGWVSDISLSWEAGGDDDDMRRRVRQSIVALTKSDVLSRHFIRHKNSQMPTVYVDHAAIVAFLTGAEDGAA